MKTVITNTLDGRDILVDGNRIAALGTPAVIRSMAGPDARILDVQKSMALPGFNDSHMHLRMTGQMLTGCRLDTAGSITEIQSILRSCHEPFVHGMGWDQENLLEKRMPERRDLDAVNPDIPIVCERYCTHILTANTAAMKLAGVWREDGIFQEAACEPLLEALDSQAARHIQAGVDHCLARGLTTVQIADLKTGNWRKLLPLYRDASQRIRIHHQVNITDPKEMEDFLREARLYETDTHTFGPFKGFADGSLGGRTAWLGREYADEPGNFGEPCMTEEEMETFVEACDRLNRPVIFHAIGDAAIRQVLAVYRRHPGMKQGILHLQITDEAILQDLERLQTDCMVQPVFWRSDRNIVEQRVGTRMARTSYAFGWMASHARVSLGTDCPIEDCDPLENIRWAVSMPGGLSEKQALTAYTEGSAWAMGRSRDLGKLAPGYLADIVFVRDGTVTGVMVNGQMTE